MSTSAPLTARRRVLALGLFRPQIGERVLDRGIQGLIDAARSSFPDLAVEIATIQGLTDFEGDFAFLTDDFVRTYAGGKFRGIASGYFVQEALEGGHGITDIHYDLMGVDSSIAQTHAGSELRSLISSIRSSRHRGVDIHFRTESGLATLRRDARRFEGAPLPGWLGAQLPEQQDPD